MRDKIISAVVAGIVLAFISSCSPHNITEKYYLRHEKVLDKIEESYKELYRQAPFTIAFTDRYFQNISLEIITDTLTYIYAFNYAEERLGDTLTRYNLNAHKIVQLIERMRAIRCTWVNNLDYYVDEKKNSLIFMSIKPVALKAPFSNKKYYILTYFSKPQQFDADGRLMDKQELRRLNKITGEILWRINDKVCYTISSQYR